MDLRDLVVFLALSGSAAAQTVWIVDRGGSGQFTEIQPAVDAASAGDRVVVRGAGPYAGFRLGKGLDVEAVGAAVVDFVQISDLPAAQWARVTGLAAGGVVPNLSASVAVQRCTGPVLLSGVFAGQGLRVDGSLAVLVLRSTLNGAPATWNSFGGLPALDARQSRVALQDSSLIGGNGLAGSPLQSPTPGGPGAALADTWLLVAHCSLHGGLGGFPFLQGPGAAGGGALFARGSGPRLVLAGGQLVGGQGTAGAPNGAAVDSSPLPVEVTLDVLVQGALQGATPIPPLTTLASPGVAPRGGLLPLTVAGAPGTFVLPFFDVRHGHQMLPGVGQPLLLTPAAVPLSLAQVGAGGVLVLTLPVPNDAALTDVVALFQAVAAPSATTVTLTQLGDVRIR